MRHARPLLLVLLALPLAAPAAAFAASDSDWQADAKAPAPGPALACAGGAGTVTPAVGAAETEYAGIGSASSGDDHDISYVRVALSTAAPDGCAAAGGTRAQIEVIPRVDTDAHPALCGVGSAPALPCAVTTHPGEFGGVIVEDARGGMPTPWAVGAPGAPVYVELPYDDANGSFGTTTEKRCAPAGPCSPAAAGNRVQLVVRYLPGTGGTPSAPILTTVGLHDDPGDEAGTGPATDDDDSDSFLYGPFPYQVSRPSLRRGWTVHAYARKGQTGKVTITVGTHLIASGAAKAKRTGKLSIKVKLTRIGPKYLAKRDAYLTIKVIGGNLMKAPIVLYGSSKAKVAGAPIARAPVCENSYLYFMPPAARADFRAALLCLLNGARKAQGLPALRRAGPLETVGQAQSDKFAETGSGGHGKSLTDITKRFAKQGYKAAAYNEGFAFLSAGASPYAFLADMVKHAGVPCTEIFDPRWRDVGIGVSATDGGAVTTLALEFGRRVGTSQPSSDTKAATTCGHKVPAPVARGPVVDGRGDPVATATSVTATLACVAKVPCAFTATAALPDAKATSPAQPLTIPAGKTLDVVFGFDAAALTAARAAAQPKVTIALQVTAPAQYADTLTAPLPAAAATATTASAASLKVAAQRLAAARARWKKLGAQSYTYTVMVSCGGCALPPAKVTVHGGKATTKPATGFGDYKTINRLFTIIKRYLADKPYAFQAKYDKTTGVPTDVFVHQDKLGTDDYYGFGTKDFKRLG
jgi:uncharacterized protein YkwD